MRDEAESGKFDAVICWDQSRWGRFNSLEAGYACYPFYKSGIKVITLNEGAIDWNDPTGRTMYGLRQESSHKENVDRARNILRGQLEAARSGSWVGSCPFGYKIVGERRHKRLVLGEPDEIAIVQRIFDEFVNQDRSMSNIASRLNHDRIPSPGGRGKPWRFDAVKWILENVAYIGVLRFNRYSRSKYFHAEGSQIVNGGRTGLNDESAQILIPKHHKSIVTHATFRKAQTILARGKTGRSCHTPENNPYLLTGKLRCGHCGEVLWGMENRTYRYYECSKRKYRGQKTCPGTTVREDVVLKRLAEFIDRKFQPARFAHLRRKAKHGTLTAKDVPQGFARLKRLIVQDTKPATDPKRIERQIESIESKIVRARKNLAFIHDPKNISSVESEIATLDERRAALEIERREQPTTADLNQTVLTVLRKLLRLSSLDKADMQAVLREIDSITCHTVREGTGTRTRHKLSWLAIRFVKGVTSPLNPHRPG